MNDEFGIPSELVQKILRTQWELREQFRDSLHVAVRLGHLLETARQQCRHGEWERWLKAHYEGTPRHARRLVELAKEYRNPDDVPSLSLREALRLIAGKSKSEKKVFAHERLHRETVDRCLKGLKHREAVSRKIIRALEVEGLTPRHQAMASAKKITAAGRALQEYLLSELRTKADDDCAQRHELAIFATEGTA